MGGKLGRFGLVELSNDGTINSYKFSYTHIYIYIYI